MALITYKIKCLRCNLHYQVHSWHDPWQREHDGGFCPECGQEGGKMIWKDVPVKMQIFEVVPGMSTLLSITEVP